MIMKTFRKLFDELMGKEEKSEYKTNMAEFQLQESNSVTISFYDGPESVFDSKIGGLPYMPENFKYPMDLRKGREEMPLAFLAQINFEQMPPLAGFPIFGILQFYIGTDVMFGLDLKNPTDQSGFRVIYFPNIKHEERTLKRMPVTPHADVSYPIQHPLAMGFTPEESIIGSRDFRFEENLLQAYKMKNPLATSYGDISVEIREKMEELCDVGGSRIGGYPFFTQEDPREKGEIYEDYTVLLLQIDSDEKYGIMWGDQGVANFFIRYEDLLKKNFSRILFHWDCY